jgi:hypothetical protein
MSVRWRTFASATRTATDVPRSSFRCELHTVQEGGGKGQKAFSHTVVAEQVWARCAGFDPARQAQHERREFVASNDIHYDSTYTQRKAGPVQRAVVGVEIRCHLMNFFTGDGGKQAARFEDATTVRGRRSGAVSGAVSAPACCRSLRSRETSSTPRE